MNSPPYVEIFVDANEEQLPIIRSRLKAALLQAGLPPYWTEFYHGWENVPIWIKKIGGNILMINSTVVWQFDGRQESIPTTESFAQMLNRPPSIKKTARWRRVLRVHFSFLVAVLIAFFPKCPFCWAAYMSLFSFFGLSTIPYKRWLLPVFIGLFIANLASIYLSRRKEGYHLLLLSLCGACVIILNRLFWNVPILIYAGAVLLLTASIANTLPVRMVNSIRMYVGLKAAKQPRMDPLQ